MLRTSLKIIRIFFLHDVSCKICSLKNNVVRGKAVALLLHLWAKSTNEIFYLKAHTCQSLYLSNHLAFHSVWLDDFTQIKFDCGDSLMCQTTEAVHHFVYAWFLISFADGSRKRGFSLDELKTSEWNENYSCFEISSKRSRMSSGSHRKEKAN